MASCEIQELKKPVTTFVLLGRPKSGKSRTGNTIAVCDTAFEFGLHTQRTSKECESYQKNDVCVIDTPGVFKFEKQNYEDIQSFTLQKGSSKIIFLLCLPIGRITDEELLSINQYFKFFGDDFAEYAIIIFTQLDEWESDMIDYNIDNPTFDDTYLHTLSEETISVVHRFHDRYLTVNNKHKTSEKIKWTSKLMEMANSMEGFSKFCSETNVSCPMNLIDKKSNISSVLGYMTNITSTCCRCLNEFDPMSGLLNMFNYN